MAKKKDKYNVRILFEGEDLEILLKVMAYHRIASGKDLLTHLLIKEYRDIEKKEREKQKFVQD